MRDRLANLRVAMFLEIGTVLGAITGAYLAGILHPRWLFVLFGVILGSSAVAMLRPRTRPVALDLLNAAAAQEIFRAASLPVPIGPWIVIVGYEGNTDAVKADKDKMKSDKAGAVAVLGKYFKLDNQDALNNAYDFFMNEVTVPYLYPEVNQFKDAVEILGKINEKVKTVDIAKMLDRSFMQSAQDRKLGG